MITTAGSRLPANPSDLPLEELLAVWNASRHLLGFDSEATRLAGYLADELAAQVAPRRVQADAPPVLWVAAVPVPDDVTVTTGETLYLMRKHGGVVTYDQAEVVLVHYDDPRGRFTVRTVFGQTWKVPAPYRGNVYRPLPGRTPQQQPGDFGGEVIPVTPAWGSGIGIHVTAGQWTPQRLEGELREALAERFGDAVQVTGGPATLLSARRVSVWTCPPADGGRLLARNVLEHEAAGAPPGSHREECPGWVRDFDATRTPNTHADPNATGTETI